MALCAGLVVLDHPRARRVEADPVVAVTNEKGVSALEAFELLRQSKHLQIIALVISFAAVGAAIIEQQLNMAAQAAKGAGATDSITAVPRPGRAVDLVDRIRDPGVADEPRFIATSASASR